MLSCLIAIGCGESPVSPDPRIPDGSGPPDILLIIDWRFGASMTTARAQASWGFGYHRTEDVTASALWESTAPDVAKIVRPGRLVSVSPGEAELRVVFRGVEAVHRLRVFPGESPLLVLDSSTTTYVSGWVRDATGTPPGNGIEGARVEIVGGHNAGRVTTTGQTGFYQFSPPFICGPITVHVTKDGYRAASASSVMCESGMPHVLMQPE